MKPTSALLTAQERARVKPAVFEDFARLPAGEAAAPVEVASLAQPPAQDEPVDAVSLPALPAVEGSQSESEPELPSWTSDDALQAAYDRGFEDGKTAAAALYEAEFRRYHQWLQRFDELARALRSQLQHLEQEAERAAVQLAFVLAEHILGNELQKNPDSVVHLLQRARAALPPESASLRIRLHPDTLEALQRAQSAVALGTEEGISVVADPSVEPGGCVIESPWGTVDAQLSQQLQSIREQLQC
jgi:flagellar assembly protein FliH